MGYRYHLYMVPKTFVNKIKNCETFEQYKNIFQEHVALEVYNQCIREDYFPLYYVGKSMFCTERSDFFNMISKNCSPLFTSNELVEHFKSDNVFVVGKEGLKKCIEFCETQIISTYEDLLRERSENKWDERTQFERMKDYIRLAKGRWVLEFVPGYHAYNLSDTTEHISRHSCWEHAMWDLVHMYKTIDWDKNDIIFMGW